MAVPEHIARDLENQFAWELMWTRRNLNQADIVATATERMLMIVWLMVWGVGIFHDPSTSRFFYS
jgi:hypothetical protein